MKEIQYQTIKISPKGQLVLPKKIREAAKIDSNSVIKVGIDPITKKVDIKIITDPIQGLKGIWKGRNMPSVEERKKEMLQIEIDTGNYD
jgi:bifunctional DNA-binding transcriptional regulator/antitoxin component of YhaV-PrlF toxin-antitoxin module